MNKEIELEMKFSKTNSDEITIDSWVSSLEQAGFEINKIISDNSSIDTYYDTSDLHFFNTDKFIRIRNQKNRPLTATLSTTTLDKKNRFNAFVDGLNYLELINKLKKHDHLVKHIDSDPKLIIENKRKTIVAEKFGISFELSIDNEDFIDPSSDIITHNEGIKIYIKNSNTKIKEVVKQLLVLITKTGSYDEESYSSKYQKGLTMIKREQKRKTFK